MLIVHGPAWFHKLTFLFVPHSIHTLSITRYPQANASDHQFNSWDLPVYAKQPQWPPKEVNGFAYLCKALTLMDHTPAEALSVLDQATGKSLEHCQLRTDPWYKPT
jgi:hypothetical protein